MIAGALANPRYRSPRHLRRHIAMLGGVVDLLTRGLPVPDDMRKAAFGRPQGALKFALILADLADRLAKLDRYERRALSRRKAAVRDFDAARAGRSGALIVLPRFGPQERGERATPPDDAARQRAARSVRRWRNKATAASPSAPNSSSERTLPPRPWGDKPIKQVPYREIAAYVAKLFHIEWPERTDSPRDGPPLPRPACGAREGEGALNESIPRGESPRPSP